ncbi:peptidoglycan editing factor PgeF [Erythrobacter sp. THAF29]|uniref:peptidoglycan editing factor PgeF n=1 Tax=Erythrobacter sp. THAF29 TaxID=2587851 RepID=UPI0012696CE5|nr:peptidoglycan editing factor PgeF [Erythrobacter sp. THAF29]QFT76212.1 Laccase domain protein YfiH [Erythrobacter sp. THAF29]
MAEAPSFDIVRAAVLGDVPHGFFGSSGGAHQFGYGGPGDAVEVRKLRDAAASAIVEGAGLVAPHQVHSPDVVTVAESWEDSPTSRPRADALVTDRCGIVLGIVTADCAPVLFADATAGVVGAAHAGWRGAHGGVLENTIAAMEALGAKRANIAAAIGPTIAQTSYEVDAAFRENFTAADEIHFAPAPEREGQARWYFDLPGYISGRLAAAGIGRVENTDRDTFASGATYHSYRRAIQAGEPDYGRQISMIGLA